MADGTDLIRDQAEARFQKAQKKQQAMAAGAQAKAEHDAAGRAMRERTVKLKEQRLAKEAADRAAAEEAKPLVKKRAAKRAATAKAPA